MEFTTKQKELETVILSKALWRLLLNLQICVSIVIPIEFMKIKCHGNGYGKRGHQRHRYKGKMDSGGLNCNGRMKEGGEGRRKRDK